VHQELAHTRSCASILACQIAQIEPLYLTGFHGTMSASTAARLAECFPESWPAGLRALAREVSMLLVAGAFLHLYRL
jgi:hypothetical protein